MKKILILIFFIVLLFLVLAERREGGNVDLLEKHQVNLDRVVDGDTLLVYMNDQKERVRLIGVDAPESTTEHVDIECFGQDSSDFLKTLLVDEENLYLEFDPVAKERDRYGRLLAHVFLEDGVNVNELIIQKGYAHEYTYQGQEYLYKKYYKLAEDFAQENQLGLWGTESCSV